VSSWPVSGGGGAGSNPAGGTHQHKACTWPFGLRVLTGMFCIVDLATTLRTVAVGRPRLAQTGARAARGVSSRGPPPEARVGRCGRAAHQRAGRGVAVLPVLRTEHPRVHGVGDRARAGGLRGCRVGVTVPPVVMLGRVGLGSRGHPQVASLLVRKVRSVALILRCHRHFTATADRCRHGGRRAADPQPTCRARHLKAVEIGSLAARRRWN
jgi:hypothetical protein